LGIIIKESLKQSVVSIGLSVIGAIATLFIYPLDRELLGIFGTILDVGALLIPLVIVGLGSASIRYFPYFTNNIYSRNKYLFFLLKLLVINCIVLILLFPLFRYFSVTYGSNNEPEYRKFFIYILPAALFFGVGQFFATYLSNFKLVTLPLFLRNLYKVFMPLAFLLVFFKMLNIKDGIHLILGGMLFSVLLLGYLVYTKIRSKEGTSKVVKNYKRPKGFYNYYFWALASSVGSMMAFKVDGYMVPVMTNFTMAGDYRMSVFIASVITIPITSVVAIASPIIAQAWKNNDLSEIRSVYLKGAKNLLFLGAAMLFGIYILLDLLPLVIESWKKLSHLKLIVMVIGIARLFDMVSSVNGVIIQHSIWYRYNSIFVIILTVINILLNIVLIKSHGILGAGIATGISLIVFNVLKSGFLYKKIGVQPLDFLTTIFFGCFIVITYLIYLISTSYDAIISIPVNSILSVCFLLFFLCCTELVSDTRKILLSLLSKVTKR